MSQCQRGVHTARFNVAQQLAKALGVPIEVLYSPDDPTAELLLQGHALSKVKKAQFLKALKETLWAWRPKIKKGHSAGCFSMWIVMKPASKRHTAKSRGYFFTSN
jgi:hypothetical protein